MFRKFLFVSVAIAFAATTNAQIEPKDSTFQVIGYWSKGEKQSYSVTESKIKINKTDTTSKETTNYKLDVRSGSMEHGKFCKYRQNCKKH